MKSYKEFVTEGKNTHMEHLEDEMWNGGSKGVANALDFARGVAEMLSGNSNSSVNITTKWDGAPAIICGINPENKKFFVGTKSVFNKATPKINYTNSDIDKNHSGDLAVKLKLALQYLSKLGIKNVIQGDFMFSSSDLGSMKVDGRPHITFTPNTITYAVEDGSSTAREIKAAKIGIVFHTEYKGRKMSEMSASFNPNIRRLKKSKNVWFRDADYKDESGSSTMTSAEHDSIISDIESAEDISSGVSKVIDEVMSNKVIISYIKTYTNSQIRGGSSKVDTNGVIGHIKTKMEDAISNLKTDSGKERKRAVLNELVKYLKSIKTELDAAFELYGLINDIKISLVRKLEKIKGIGTFVRTDDGFKATAPEGFVAVDRISSRALKLVDRLEFSRSNFTVAKNWVSG